MTAAAIAITGGTSSGLLALVAASGAPLLANGTAALLGVGLAWHRNRA